MKPFQKFIFLFIFLFVLVGAWQLSVGTSFLSQFTLDIFGFLAIAKFVIPALAYVYIYEKLVLSAKSDLTLLSKYNIDLFKIALFQKPFFVTFGLVLVVSVLIIISVLNFGTHKIEYLEIFNPTVSPGYFMFMVVALDLHKRIGIMPIIRLNEKPIFYLKLFVFTILGICAGLLLTFALTTLIGKHKLLVSSTQFIIDCILYAVLVVTIAFWTSFIVNKITFFRLSVLISIVFTTAITFWVIKISGCPQDYFRDFITEHILLMIAFFSCLLISTIPIGRSKRNLIIKKLTSDFSKKEAEYLQLKNQINPHFLFNNLNVLISFIELDPKKAIDFGHHLSNVYRHYLKNQTEDFVSLQGEIDFIAEYLSIYKAKFEKGFSFKILDEIDQNLYVLPNCLQELIDNIFKHNVIAEEMPLEIEILLVANVLIIQNTINKKSIENSSNFGLNNIKKRYTLLTNKEIQIVQTKTHFKVIIPILELES